VKNRVLSIFVWSGVLFCALWAVFSTQEKSPSPSPSPSPSATATACELRAGAEQVRWSLVHDGDTLTLADGRRVRVIGINTPEVADSGPGEPFADEATRAVRAYLSGSSTVLLLPGAAHRDRYGRLLAHVFRPDGGSLAAELLRRGLAWHVAVPPNLGYLDCYQGAQRVARTAARGVWSQEYLSSDHARRLQSGFRVLRAGIQRVVFKGNWWLETDAGFALRIQSSDQSWFERSAVASWQGASVEVRGWMVNRADSGSAKRGHLPWMLLLRHPADLRILH
jgi:endonuclease YncB( thermonuclease family)